MPLLDWRGVHVRLNRELAKISFRFGLADWIIAKNRELQSPMPRPGPLRSEPPEAIAFQALVSKSYNYHRWDRNARALRDRR